MIGQRIKTLREQSGFTQTMLARKLGLSRSAVNAWEMGISIPSTQYLVELARLFHVSTDFILGLTEDGIEQIDIGFLDEEEKATIRSMLNHFKRCHDAMDVLESHGLPASPE